MATARLTLVPVALFGLLTPHSLGAQTLTTLYSFSSSTSGIVPYNGLVQDKAGNFYGATLYGGSSNDGTVFELNPKNTESVLHSFGGGNDGNTPSGLLILGASGKLYGSTQYGGSSTTHCYTPGCGIVFSIDPSSHKETILYAFSGANDGACPCSVVEDSTGDVYGTAQFGGANHYGAIFKISSAGTQTVLYSFTGGKDGGFPNSLQRDSAGNLYGTTFAGGTLLRGTIFRFDTAGKLGTLYNFRGMPDGQFPQGPLTVDSAGNLYGTARQGGVACDSGRPFGCGVVYKFDVSGKETVLHRFTAGADGESPSGGVALDASGNLYGVTPNGGGSPGIGCHCGVLFKVDSAGKETIVHTFTGGQDGAAPYGPLLWDGSSNFYGLASGGGASNAGAIFKLTL